MFRNWPANSRRLILQRDLPRVTCFEAFKALSRANNYKSDEFSKGNPLNAVAACGDLGADEPMMGALDAKCAKGSEVWTRLNIHAVNSPMTSDSIPVFGFSALPSPYTGVAHDSLPDACNHSFILFAGLRVSVCARHASRARCVGAKFCESCRATAACMPGDAGGRYFGETRASAWTVAGQVWVVLGCCLGAVALAALILAIVLVVVRRRRPVRSESRCN